MDLSVIIRCCDDTRIFRCIDSIHDDVEIIVSTTANGDIQSRLEGQGVSYCIVPKGNLSLTSNAGFDAATHEKVFFTDSDTYFDRSCLKHVDSALDQVKVVSAKIIFEKHPRSPFSRLVAEAREYVNSLPVVYTPGIGVRKSLKEDIGGFLFNDAVPFAVDADLTYRIHRANIPVRHLYSALLYHDAETVYHDLNSAFRIGAGCMESAFDLVRRHEFPDSPHSIVQELKGVKREYWYRMIRTKGFLVFLYQLLWDISFYTGRTHHSIQHSAPWVI